MTSSASARSRRGLPWLVGCGLAIAWLALPVGVSVQTLLAPSLILLMVGAACFGHGLVARHVVSAAAVFVVVRYVVWRLDSTLPPASDPVGLAVGLILVAAEFYCVAILAVSLLVNADPLRRPAPPAPTPDDAPTVDVFIPTYNESTAILAVTVAAALRMDYPAGRKTVWLLDDGGSDQKCADKDPARAAAARARRLELQRLCRELGAVYLTRARNEHAKAGNLNNGLLHGQGELVLVLDADHAPFRQFLTETVGHFGQDPRLFLVQTPHVFLNPDPIEKNLATFDRMPSENEMFYALTQRGLDKWNGSFFCGSAALLRRTALESVGGFSGITITEDCETALDLHARGWTSLYVDKPLIAGLQPETFDSFIGQRSRWCQGMLQILLLKNPARRPGLSLIQRLAYLSSMTFWFFPLPRLVFMLAPLVYLVLDVRFFVASFQETLAYSVPYMVAGAILQNHLYGRLRWPWVSELYEYAQGLYLARAIGAVLLSPRKPTFNVTAKGDAPDHDHVSALVWPYAAVFAALLGGVALAAWRAVTDPGSLDVTAVVGGWCLFSAVIAGAAMGALAERRQETPWPRLPVDRRGVLRIDGRAVPVTITAASTGDCLVSADVQDLSAPGRTGELSVEPWNAGEHLESVRVDVAADGQGRLVLTWGEPSARTANTVADLVYADAAAIARMLGDRRRHKGLLAGTAQMIGWAIAGPVRVCAYALARRKPTPATAIAPAAVPEMRATGWDDPSGVAAALVRRMAGHLPPKAEPATPPVALTGSQAALARLVAESAARLSRPAAGQRSNVA
ncbi:UDP-forming cellulose synthase catalytic subunit [uncultured Alsobacter sp.]|uniref:UDP-forming cellulose synthase catalytic subunit n=1 Tax=uncultured Alsobacter sp. TaxID=1748258 RepID=UPI0025E1700B|nr:UDP-forming cellulose synthase catalytic subunit [uncultured Alsobacter sp.]